MAITNEQKELLNKETPAMKALGFGGLFQLVQTTLATAVTNITTVTALAGKRVSIAIKDGTNNTAVDITALDPAPTAIIAVLAITKSTGAVASKFLQAVTTDYTFNAGTGAFACVGDKSALTLIIIYK